MSKPTAASAAATQGATDRAGREPGVRRRRRLRGLIVLASTTSSWRVFMAIAPHAFFTAIGPFEELNRHYIRDIATYSAAIGVGAAGRDPAPLLAGPRARDLDGPVRAAHASTTSSTRAPPTRSGRLVRLLLAARRHALLAWMWRFAAREEGRRERPRVAAQARNPLARTSVSLPPRRKEHVMTVVEGVPAAGHPLIRLTYALARREVRRMTGKSLLTPDIPVRAHRFGQLVGLRPAREERRRAARWSPSTCARWRC